MIEGERNFISPRSLRIIILRRIKAGSRKSPWSLLLRPWANRTEFFLGFLAHNNLSPPRFFPDLRGWSGVVVLIARQGWKGRIHAPLLRCAPSASA